MMARTHAPLSGGIAGLALTYYFASEEISQAWARSSEAGWASGIFESLVSASQGVSLREALAIFVAVFVVGGYALAPDLDEPRSTIVKKSSPVGDMLSPIVSAMMGGHRNGSHSLIVGIPALAALGWISTYTSLSWVFMCLFGAHLSTSLIVSSQFLRTPIVMAVGGIAWWSYPEITPALGAILVGGGALLHAIEDIPFGRVSILWPIFKTRFGFKLRTDGLIERGVMLPLAGILSTATLIFGVVVPISRALIS